MSFLFPYFHEVITDKNGNYRYDHYFTTDQTALDSWIPEK